MCFVAEKFPSRRHRDEAGKRFEAFQAPVDAGSVMK
jgi:hypothetical protein